MNILVKTFLAIALVVGAAVALLLSGENVSGFVMGSRMMSSGAGLAEFGGYTILLLLIAALGSVVAWMLVRKNE